MSDRTLEMNADTAARAAGGNASVGDFIALLKPRVMSLVIFTALVGMVAAPGSLHPVLAVTALLCIAVGAGASAALNMWYDADIDAVMGRTRLRPVPRGAVTGEEALAFGLILSAFSVLTLGLLVSWAAAALLAFTIFFYAVIYTMWLKRSTPQNIVIGGAAGAFPPMIGWAAVTGGVSVESIVLFLLIFFWTPPHFWALALYKSEDYARAGVPMLPVVAGDKATRSQIWLYSLLLAPLGLTPAAVGLGGPLYLAVSAVLGVLFLVLAWQVRVSEGAVAAKRLFAFSILYLFLLFALLLAEPMIGIVPFAPVLGGMS
ncbi:MAG: protoheme IX farnesyltransferase [Rhodobiaceae bacterium]|nr:protoheme IX farnesyltransferase [Rhodobiaceae bacterium]